MEPIEENFILEKDAELVAHDVKLHQRPFHVVLQWMKLKGYSGDVFDERIWKPLMESYRKLYPNGDFSIPPMLSGGVAIRDQMYPVRISLGYGTVSMDPLKLIEIPQAELELAFRHFPDQGWRAFYGACDALDLAYGIDDLTRGGTPKPELFVNARSNVSATTRILMGDVDIDAAVQSSCLSAELALKGALAHLGLDDKDLKHLSHNLPKLAGKLVELGPNRCAVGRCREAIPKLRRRTVRSAWSYAGADDGARNASTVRGCGYYPSHYRPPHGPRDGGSERHTGAPGPLTRQNIVDRSSLMPTRMSASNTEWNVRLRAAR